MKIVDAHCWIIPIPTGRDIITPVDRFGAVQNVVIILQTDEGIDGLGLAWTTTEPNARVIRSMVEALLPLLKDADALAPEASFARMWNATNTLGHRGVAMIAISAIEIAFWDIMGKAANLPLWRLLGGATSTVSAYASGLFLMDDVPTIVDEARRLVSAGFSLIKMRVGLPDRDEDVTRVAAVRDAVGSDIGIAVDAVQAWDAMTAISMADRLADLDLRWIEDPVAYDNPEVIAYVRARSPVPIATGEKEYTIHGFRELLKHRAADILLPDVQRVGGITEWKKISAMSEAEGVPVTPHALPQISAQLVGATGNATYVEYLPWWNDLLVGLPAPVQGRVILSEMPGLGLTLCESKATSIH